MTFDTLWTDLRPHRQAAVGCALGLALAGVGLAFVAAWTTAPSDRPLPMPPEASAAFLLGGVALAVWSASRLRSVPPAPTTNSQPPIGRWNYHVESGEVTCCPNMVRLFGLPRRHGPYSELVAPLIHPDDGPAVESAVLAALEPSSTGRYVVRYRITRPDGSSRLITAEANALFAGDGPTRRILRLVGTVQDVTPPAPTPPPHAHAHPLSPDGLTPAAARSPWTRAARPTTPRRRGRRGRA